jgi:hypothetical protein
VSIIADRFRVKGNADFNMTALPSTMPDLMPGGAERLRLAQ